MLEGSIAGPYAGVRLVQRLQPAAGAGTKVFPPTFEGGVILVPAVPPGRSESCKQTLVKFEFPGPAAVIGSGFETAS
jgi:hypothetical protein